MIDPAEDGAPPLSESACQFVQGSLFGVQLSNSSETPFTPLDLGYPLFTGYSDFFGISEEVVEAWLSYLGPLSAMSLFPEVAIPTARVLAAENLVTLRDADWGFQILWGDDRKLVDDLHWVRSRFMANDAFIHPMKFNTFCPEYLSELAPITSLPNYLD